MRNLRTPTTEGALVVSDDWRVVGMSAVAAEYLGITPADALGKKCADVLHCRDLNGNSLRARCPVSHYNRRGSPSSRETWQLVARDCSGRNVSLSATIGLTCDEADGHVMVLLRPNATSASAGTVAAADSANGALNTILSHALGEALGETGAEAAEIFLRDPVGQQTFLAAFRGDYPRAFHQLTLFNDEEGFPGIVAHHARPIMALDLARDDRFLRTRVKEKGFSYYLCVPILSRQGAAGSLHVASRLSAQTVVPHWPTLHRIADHLSMAIEVDELRSREELSAYRLDPGIDAQETLEQVVEHALAAAVRLGEADGGTAIIRTGRHVARRHDYALGGACVASCTAAGGLPAGCPALAENDIKLWPLMAERNAPSCVDGKCGSRSAVCLPLVVDGQHVGVISLAFEQRDVPVHLIGRLSAIAVQAAQTINTAQNLVVMERLVRTAERRRLLPLVHSVFDHDDASLATDGAPAPVGRGRARTPRRLKRRRLLRLAGRKPPMSAGSLPLTAPTAGIPSPEPRRGLAENVGLRAESTFLDLRCLGTFSALRDGAHLDLEKFGRRRSVTVLKILLTRYGKVVSRDELVDLLWPEDPPHDAHTLLKVAVHYLRQGLEPYASKGTAPCFIVTGGGGYAFAASAPHRLDVQEMLAGIDHGLRLEHQGRCDEAVAAYARAADLYVGDYLEDEPYSDWCQTHRERLRQAFFTLLRRLAWLRREGGDCEGAIECYRRALWLDPALEDFHRDLMEVLWQAGRRAEALRQYQACRQALRQEVGVAPHPETEALYHHLLGQV